MSLADHIDAIKKEMTSLSSQFNSNKSELERSKQDLSSMQLQMQQQMNDSVQQDLQKAHDTSKKLDNLARTFLALITDPSQQSQLLAEFESISKNGTPQMPVMTPPMMNAVAAMQPHMMMRNPMLNAMGGASPRVSGKGGAPQNGGMNGMSMMQHMQMQAFQAQMMQAQMFQQMPMMMPGMVPGMPPGMAGLPGMMPPNNMAAAMQHFNAVSVNYYSKC